MITVFDVIYDRVTKKKLEELQVNVMLYMSIVNELVKIIETNHDKKVEDIIDEFEETTNQLHFYHNYLQEFTGE